jgi:hypothetical protein
MKLKNLIAILENQDSSTVLQTGLGETCGYLNEDGIAFVVRKNVSVEEMLYFARQALHKPLKNYKGQKTQVSMESDCFIVQEEGGEGCEINEESFLQCFQYDTPDDFESITIKPRRGDSEIHIEGQSKLPEIHWNSNPGEIAYKSKYVSISIGVLQVLFKDPEDLRRLAKSLLKNADVLESAIKKDEIRVGLILKNRKKQD